VEELGHSGYAGTDEQQIARRTKQHDCTDVFAPQTLTKYERILRPDRHDQAGTQHQAREEARW
jgi:hypothetical protein